MGIKSLSFTPKTLNSDGLTGKHYKPYKNTDQPQGKSVDQQIDIDFITRELGLLKPSERL